MHKAVKGILLITTGTIKWLFLGLLVVVLTVGVKLFFIDSYKVSTISMEPFIQPVEYVLVNKLAYGPRWPQSPIDISWFNLLALNRRLRPWFINTKWPYKRWPKVGPVSRNDVIVFEGPVRNKTVLVKRCTGLPGDILSLSGDEVYVNSALGEKLETVVETYNNAFRAGDVFEVTQEEWDDDESQYIDGPYMMSFAKLVTSSLPPVDLYRENRNTDFGPVLVPSRGLTVNLKEYLHEIRLYKKVIREYEGHEIEVEGNTILIDGGVDSLFTFSNNYYFMMGDNRRNSLDSRRWGFVPEQNLIGKVTLIWFSSDESSGSIRWDRIFLRIR